MKKLLSLFLIVLLAAPAFGLEVAGVKLDDTAKVGDASLALNGAGLRTRMFIKVYVGALYLAKKAAAGDAAISDTGAKRVSLHMLRDLKAEQISSALNEGLVANNSAADIAKLEGKIKEFTNVLNSASNAKKGDVINIDYLPGTGTRISINGDSKGTVAGEDFNRALLKVWLGDKPVDADLKKGMLGG
ncbi:MAG: chalcone isomerase family protein [Burkholderiales bacterium]